jgi:hypothetical protein
MIAWPIIDHYRFFVLIGWSKRHTQAQVRDFSYKLFALAQMITAYAMLRLATDDGPEGPTDVAQKKQSPGNSAKGPRGKINERHRVACVKAALTTLTIGHVSNFPGLRLGEIVCGASGAIASAMDVYAVWPKKCIPVKESSD